MAVTWKHFFQGLAQGMPQLGELVYNYTIWSNQQRLEEKKTEAYVGMMEAQTESFELSNEEKRIGMKTLEEVNNLKLDTERMINQLKKKDLLHYDEEYDLKIRELSTRIEVNLENLKANSAQVTTEGLRQLFLNEEAGLRRMDFQMKVMGSWFAALADPKQASMLGELKDKFTNQKNGSVDWSGANEEFISNPQYKKLSPLMRESFGGLLQYMTSIGIQNNEFINTWGGQQYKLAWNPEEEGKKWRKDNGVDKLWGKDGYSEAIDTLIRDNMKSMNTTSDLYGLGGVAKILPQLLYPTMGEETTSPVSFNPFVGTPYGGFFKAPEEPPNPNIGLYSPTGARGYNRNIKTTVGFTPNY